MQWELLHKTCTHSKCYGHLSSNYLLLNLPVGIKYNEYSHVFAGKICLKLGFDSLNADLFNCERNKSKGNCCLDMKF